MLRPTGNNHPGLGEEGLAVPGRSGDRVRVLGGAGHCCPETGHAEGLRASAECRHRQHLLEQFSKTIPDDVQAGTLWGWCRLPHRPTTPRSRNVALAELPADSPELNPIENLWHYLKSHFWSNRAYKDYESPRTSRPPRLEKSCSLDHETDEVRVLLPYLKLAPIQIRMRISST